MARGKVKVVSIQYGLLGHPDNARIERAIEKWTGKGYTLKNREETPPRGCLGSVAGKTHMTFMKED